MYTVRTALTKILDTTGRNRSLCRFWNHGQGFPLGAQKIKTIIHCAEMKIPQNEHLLGSWTCWYCKEWKDRLWQRWIQYIRITQPTPEQYSILTWKDKGARRECITNSSTKNIEYQGKLSTMSLNGMLLVIEIVELRQSCFALKSYMQS